MSPRYAPYVPLSDFDVYHTFEEIGPHSKNVEELGRLMDEVCYEGPMRRLLAAGQSIAMRGNVRWQFVFVSQRNRAEGKPGRVTNVCFWVHAQSTGGHFSKRAYHFDGPLEFIVDGDEVLEIRASDQFARAVVISATGDGTEFTGGLVSKLLIGGVWKALAKMGAHTLNDALDTVSQPIHYVDWFEAVMANRDPVPEAGEPRETRPSRRARELAAQAEQAKLFFEGWDGKLDSRGRGFVHLTGHDWIMGIGRLGFAGWSWQFHRMHSYEVDELLVLEDDAQNDEERRERGRQQRRDEIAARSQQ